MSTNPVTLPQGFRCSGVHAGLKKNPQDLDLALIAAQRPCAAAGMFTRNHFPGEPVKLARARLEAGRLQALAVNSRISNVATGADGYRAAQAICAALARELGIPENLALISSTGVIGRPYPPGKIEAALPRAVAELGDSAAHLERAARAIMTTDTVPKFFSRTCGAATLTLLAKGAGMIAPDMATMLAFILTDARFEPGELRALLGAAVESSFNCMSVDFDTSTSDSCFLLASGLAGPVDSAAFAHVLGELCADAALALVRDGEGVTRAIECRVRGASSPAQAKAVAASIANSPLVKTMITGADPNWGRVLMAIGKVRGEPEIARARPSIAICDEVVFRQGAPAEPDLKALSARMKERDPVLIEVDLGLGAHACRYLGANLTAEYVSINADYTT